MVKVQGLGVRVLGSGFWVLRFWVQVFRVQGFWGFQFRVQGLGFGAKLPAGYVNALSASSTEGGGLLEPEHESYRPN